MLVLGVDNSSLAGSVALVEQGRLLACVQRCGRPSYSRRLLASVRFVLEEAGRSEQQLGGLAVAVGPGSFTGLRVGLAAVIGLALALELEIAAVPSLEAYAAEVADYGGILVPMLDAHRRQVFSARFRSQGGQLTRLTPDAVLEPQQALAELPADAVVHGIVTTPYLGLAEALEPRPRIVRAEPCAAPAVARLGAELLAAGSGVPPERLEARYVRASDAELDGPRPPRR